MKNYTNTISVNGWINVGTALRAATPAYPAGVGLVRSLTVVNDSASACYLHFADGTQPSTAANGLLISSAGPGVSFTAKDVDIDTTWVNTSGALNVTFAIIAHKGI